MRLWQWLLVILFTSLQRHDRSSWRCNAAASQLSEVEISQQLGNLKQSSILVIGAAGFIGSRLVKALSLTGLSIQVHCLDSFAIDYNPVMKRFRADRLMKYHNVHIIEHRKEFCDTRALAERISSQRFTHVVVLAANADRGGRGQQSFHCVKHLMHYVASLQRPNLLESQNRSQLHRNEAEISKPPTFYFTFPDVSMLPGGEGRKVIAQYETLIRSPAYVNSANRAVTAIGLRFPSVYGPWDKPNSLPSIFLESLYGSKSIQFGADRFETPPRLPPFISNMWAQQEREYTYIDDVVVAIIKALAYRGEESIIVDVKSPDAAVSPHTLLRKLEFVSNITAIIERVGASNDSLASSGVSIETQQVRTQSLPVVQYSGKTSLDSGLRDFYRWYKRFKSRQFPCTSECHREGWCFRSEWEKVAMLSRQLTDRCQHVYYTIAIDETVDGLHPIDNYESPYLCNIAFVSERSPFVRNLTAIAPSTTLRRNLKNVDMALLSSPNYHPYGNWTVIIVHDFTQFRDPRKPTRVPKLSPSNFFSSTVRYAVYMDSKLLLTCDPREYIAMLDPAHPDNDGRALAMLGVRISEHESGIFYHISHILNRTNERPSITFYKDRLEQQGRAYREYKRIYGVDFVNVFDGAFLIHDLKSEAGRRFRCSWYGEYQLWSDRDQVAGSYALTRSAYMMKSAAANYHKEFIPIGVEHGLASMAYSTEKYLSDDAVHINAANRSSRRYVRLLPRLAYHWEFNVSRIGRLALFDWNRIDDRRFANESEYMMNKFLKHYRRDLRKKRRLIYASMCSIGVAGVIISIYILVKEVRQNRGQNYINDMLGSPSKVAVGVEIKTA